MSVYRLQIVGPDGQVVKSWPPGSHVETELISELCERVKAKGVGLGRTEAHVLADLKAAFTEMLYDLKAKVR